MDQVSLNSSVEASFQPLCRVCLATDIKMFDLQSKELYQKFFDLTGLQLSIGDGLQNCICYICCALLKRAISFRNKCLSSYKLLSNNAVTLDFLKQRNLLHCKPLTRTDIVTQNLISNSSDKNYIDKVKSENSSESENYPSEIDQNDDFSNTDKLRIINKEIVCNEHLNNTTRKKNCRAKTLASNKKRCNNIEIENCDSTDVLSTPSLNRTKSKLNEYILKYTDGLKHCNLLEKGDELTDSDDDLNPLSVYTNIVQNDNNKTDEKTKKCNNIGDENNAASLKKDKNTSKRREEYKAKSKSSKDIVKRKRTGNAMRTKAALEKFDKIYNCKVVTLSKQEQVDAVKARAENKKYKNGTYKCEDCYTGFVNESKFISHRKTHDPAISGNVECEICHMRFKSRLQYTRHAINHKYKYICKECGSVCYNRSFAKNHHETHAGVKYECQFCKQVFSKYASRVNHVRNKHGSARCDICYGRLGGGSALGLHRALAHRQTYKCSSCERIFNDPEALKRHMKGPDQDVCDISLRPCTRCGECFNMGDEDLFNCHIEIHKTVKEKKINKNEEDTNFIIKSENDRDVCDTQFGAKRRERKKLMCEICALDNFKSITALRIHQRIHSGEKPFQCPTCPKSFRLKHSLQSITALRIHQRIHSGEKPFQCPTCPKSFRLKHSLQWHIRTHTGDRPYACDECPKAFKTNTARIRHRLVHTNERRHVCELCGKAFQTSTNVKLHVRTVHMKIPMPPRVRSRKKRTETDILLKNN